MKVTTDGCLFGAIVAAEVKSHTIANILDIGTGTGLLSLMIAQQNSAALIDAIEIDKSVAQQARENTTASPWAERIKIIDSDILDYPSVQLYNIIISNPPFYEKQLTSPEVGRQQAHHSSRLTLQQLFQQAKRLIQPDGQFFVMLPYYRTAETISIAAVFSFTPVKHWFIQQTPDHACFRSIFCFSLLNAPACLPVNICIEAERHVYDDAFAALLKAYYLKL